MKIIKLEQGKNSWLNWRKEGIGASEISILMGSNPYKTPLKLWNVKCGYEGEDFINAAMKHGMDNEEAVRQKMNKLYGIDLQPLCIEDEDFPFMKASLDGYDMKEQVLGEIKCPISELILNAAKQDKIIPGYWLDQVQWQIMLCKPKRAFIVLWDHRTDEDIIIDVLPLPERIEKMKKIAHDFWDKVRRGEPPRHQKGDFLKREDSPLKSLFSKYCEFFSQEKHNKKMKDIVKEKIVNLCDGRDVKCNGWTISQSQMRVSYDTELMRIEGIDLDKYIKTSKKQVSYRITAPR